MHLQGLKNTVNGARKTKLYADSLAGIRFASKADISKLPTTTKDQLRKSFPFEGLAVSQKNVVEVHTTSGTTGDPTISFYTQKDLDRCTDELVFAWKKLGINKSSVVQFIMSYGLFSGAMLNTYAIKKLGALVVPSGIIPLQQQLKFMIDFKVNYLVATPSFYLYLADFLDNNPDYKNRLKITRGVAAGEIYSEETRQIIESRLGIEIRNHYGLCEVYTGLAYECDQKDGLHVLGSLAHPEILEIDSDSPTKLHESGELVLTSINKEASPVIRYRTGDITKFLPGNCPCGDKSKKIARIESRVDDVITIKGIKINPHELKSEILKTFSNDIYSDILFAISENSLSTQPEIRLSFRPNSDAATTALDIENHIYHITRLKFKINNMEPISSLEGRSMKNKLVEYI